MFKDEIKKIKINCQRKKIVIKIIGIKFDRKKKPKENAIVKN
jgi:hypothetical protein